MAPEYHRDPAKNKMNKSWKNYWAVTKNGANALDFDHIF